MPRRSEASLPPIFDVLSASDRERLAQHARIVSLKKGETLWTDGQPVEDLAVVRAGCLAAVLPDPLADEEVEAPVSTFVAGQLVARSLTEVRPALMTVRALASSTVLLVPLAQMRPVVLGSPALIEAVSDYFMRSLYTQRYFAARMVNAPVERRLAHALWALSSVDRQGRRLVNFKVGQAELARMVGTDRSELSRKKQWLAKTGMIRETPEGLELLPVLRLMLLGDSGLPRFLLDELGR